MALQLFKIANVTVATPQATIDFSSIPQGYTDLILVLSTRSSRSATEAEFRMTVNGSATGYSNRAIQSNGSTVSSFTYGTTFFYLGEMDGDTATANTFANAEIYIPNYAGSNYKSISTNEVSENNATGGAYCNLVSGLWSNTAAISSISITPSFGNFVAGSTATLYGVL